jgi:hypothetical protein
MLTLRLREIGTQLPGDGADPLAPAEPSDSQQVWSDSTLELERGLDVVELPVDLVQPEATKP